MARINNLSNFLTDVATAIKNKKGSETPIPAANFDTEISNLPSQGVYQHKQVTVVDNGSVTVLPDTGYDAIDQLDITVNIPLQQKTYTFTQNTTTTITPEQGYAGFSQVGLEINVPSSQINNQNKTITQNGSYTADTGYTGLGTVVVSVEDPEYTTNLTLSQQILGGSIILPYIELDYLRTNNGYIALDETCYFGATSIILKYALLSNGAQNLVFFDRDNGRNSMVKYGFQTSSTNEILYRYGSTTDNSTNTTCYVNIPITAKLTPTNVTIDNIVKRTHTTVSDIITDSYYLPAYRSSNTDVHTSDIRIYQFQVLTNDTLIHNLIPVIKREDNLVYLYDTITETYYRSSRFIAGPEKI